MNKRIFAVFLLFFFLLSLIILNINDAKNKLNEYLNINNKISELLLLDRDFNKFVTSKLEYKNYDNIVKIIANIEKNIEYILNKEMNENFNSNDIREEFLPLKSIFYKKIKYIEKIKSTDAIINNSFRYVQSMTLSNNSLESHHIYTSILTMHVNKELDINKLIKSTLLIKDNEIFSAHARNFFLYYKKYLNIEKKIYKLNVSFHMSEFVKSYEEYLFTIFNYVFLYLFVLISILIVLILAFLRFSNTILTKQIDLDKFKRAVDNSDNVIFITNYDKKIKYVNKAFEISTGYSFEDIKNKDTSLFESHSLNDNVYKNLNETIYAGKVWRGEFVKINKDNTKTYEKVSISPIFDNDGKIIEFLAIKLNITEERESELKLANDKELLSQQSKMVAIGDMLESIAHQWRQPLSTISVSASGMKLKKDFDDLSTKEFDELTDIILFNTKYLSAVISGFSEFFKKDSKIIYFDMNKTLNKVLDLLEFSIKDIIVHKDIENLEVKGFENELMQVFASIITNSLDALNKMKSEKKYLFIKIYKKEDNIIIKIKDNAKGIKEENISSVFEPYFTTKHKSQGRGLGLYMSYEIINKYFKGDITVNNVCYEFEDENESGCEFIITIPNK